jgi:predicted RNA-binding protein with EMAP domain
MVDHYINESKPRFEIKMKALARAILNLSAFLELSSDDIVDPDSALQALEQLSNDLKQATPGELEYLKAAIRQEIVEIGDERTPEQQHRIEFFLDFMENLGLNKQE